MKEGLKNFRKHKLFIRLLHSKIMAEERQSMPSGMGGLVRYFDEYQSKIQLKPAYVVLLIVLVILVEIIIRL